MKKLFILIMLAFLLCPCTTWAEDPHTHNGIDFEPWSYADYLPTEEGSYFLTNDVTISTTSYYDNVVTGTLSLCLNGHKIVVSDTYYAKFIYEVPEGATLNLYDCNTATTQGYVSDKWHQGILASAQSVSVVGGYTDIQNSTTGCVLVNGGTFNQYGGNLSGGVGGWYNSSSKYAGGVTVMNNGTYNLHEGTVVGCMTGSGSAAPTNVIVNKGTFNMYGGAVKASGTTTSGSIDIMSEGVFNMCGGKICENIEGVSDVKGMLISGVFNMYGGQISDNTLKYGYTACVYGNGGSFNMYGGEIKNNTTLNGAVYAGGSITYKFGGNAVVEGNKNTTNKKCNVFISQYDNDHINIATGTDAPTTGMNVGVTVGYSDGLGKFTNPNDNAANYVGYFFSDAGHGVVCKNDKCLYIHNHSHGNWLFAAEGNVITAQCRNADCDEPPYKCQYITLNASDQIYNGSPYEANYQQITLPGVTPTISSIVYYKRNESSPLPGAPSGRGLYTAKLTVTLNSENFTITKDFKIMESYNLTDGDYYLYNTASGKWFGAGNENGFQASLTEAPEFVHVGSAETDGLFIIKSYINEDGKYFDGSVINSTEPCQVQFLKPDQDDGSVGNNVCTITSTNDVYGYDGSSSVLCKNATGVNSYWEIYTKAQLIERLQNADLNNTMDATFLILDPSFGRSNSNFSKWEGEPLNKGSYNDMHASKNGDKFNVYQDLDLNWGEGEIPNGIYELSVQGFYTSESDKRCAYFYANNEAMALKNISSIAHQPTTEEEASAAFTDGKYQCSTLRFLVMNNKIRIGVKGVYGECGWTAFDNFRLMYLGPTSQLNN